MFCLCTPFTWLWAADDEDVVVARRNSGLPRKAQYEEHFVQPVTSPASTLPVEHQPLAVRAAQENIPRARPRQRRPTEALQDGLQHFDDDFVDAGAVDAGDDSDASEMSKEANGDHDVNIEDFDRPLMSHSVEVAARNAGVPTNRRGACRYLATASVHLQQPDFMQIIYLQSMHVVKAFVCSCYFYCLSWAHSCVEQADHEIKLMS